ncbi:hypothetical protein ABEB36_004542 [Hypothenemus hampei]|uniref:HMG box domain-containing protein n=1 Tax=Hypothenemus hampei TaxID=57062 RepID=A0ABD1F7D7_HYPHA
MNSIQNSYVKPHSSSNYFYMETPPSPVVTKMSSVNEKQIGEVWSEHNFDTNKVKVENLLILNNVKTTWGTVNCEEPKDEDEEDMEPSVSVKSLQEPEELQSPEDTSPAHHARRPPNAFLIFCKKHRPVVRLRYPTTENRGVTKILGEWWALLNPLEKQPYNDLAKEYKDAFLTANPGFRWYKLPAPPLRTLTTRPTTISKPAQTIVTSDATPILSEFTPGKLADESQLGGLTSLMNNFNNNTVKKFEEHSSYYNKIESNNNNNEALSDDECKTGKFPVKLEDMYCNTTAVAIKAPKPIKKRIFDQYEDEKNGLKHIFEEKDLTQQDILNKVVDDIFAQDKDEPKEQRKSDRMCKGKRYERFMVEGKLLGNKKDTKLTQHHKSSRIDSKIEHELMNKPAFDLPSFNLENTIKRLAERTNVKIDCEDDIKLKIDRVRTSSETSSEGQSNHTKTSRISFNLDERIDNLPGLSYEDFVSRKRESKKRKMKIKSENNNKMQRVDSDLAHSIKMRDVTLVGSKKRKNKSSITHLNISDDDGAKGTQDNNALAGLVTLAMVAASTEKISEHSVT